MTTSTTRPSPRRRAQRLRTITPFIAAPLVALVAIAAGCNDDPIGRDLADTTPPTLTMSVTASATAVGGVQDVAPGSSVALTPPGGSILMKASDPNGVSFVEIWLTTQETCGGQIKGPTLAGAPARHVDGITTPTSAPRALTAIFDINTEPHRVGCSYRYEVWGRAANAASIPVEATTAIAFLTLTT